MIVGPLRSELKETFSLSKRKSFHQTKKRQLSPRLQDNDKDDKQGASVRSVKSVAPLSTSYAVK